MPQITISLFILAGSFVPGAVLAFALTPVLNAALVRSCPDYLFVWFGALPGSASIAFGILALCLVFAVGGALSDGCINAADHWYDKHAKDIYERASKLASVD